VPECNNSIIQEYKIYIKYITEIDGKKSSELKQVAIKSASTLKEGDVPWCEVKDLQADTCYYFVITAVSDKGEGYKNKMTTMVRTMPQSLNDSGSLYVWGSNKSSEIGLNDETLAKY